MFYVNVLLKHYSFLSSSFVSVSVYLHIENREDANLVSQHALCPVLIYSPDYCQHLILEREEMSETTHTVSIHTDTLYTVGTLCFHK